MRAWPGSTPAVPGGQDELRFLALTGTSQESSPTALPLGFSPAASRSTGGRACPAGDLGLPLGDSQ